MAGLLDAWAGDDTTKDEYGMTQADRRQPLWSGLINAGLLAIAGGQRMLPEQRAQYIAQAGQTLGGIPAEMSKMRSEAAQQTLRAQQIQSQKAELAQAEKWRTYANSPEFQEAMKGLSPAQRAVAMGAAAKGDWGSVEKMIDPAKLRPKVDASGMITMPDGRILNAWGQEIVGPGGVMAGPGATGGPNSTVKLDEVLAPSKIAGRDDAFLKQIAEQYGPAAAKQVRDIADYKVPLPISARTAAIANPNSPTAMLVQWVTSYAPDWQQGDFANQNKLWNEFYGSGKTAKNITALDTAYGHLGTFYDVAKALNNNDSQAANAAVNFVREKMGHPEVTNARMAMLAVGHELAKVFRDSGMSQTEIEAWEKQLSPNLSPAQMQGAIEKAMELMQGRVESLQTQYKRGSKGAEPGQWFTPTHVEKHEFIKQNPLATKSSAARPPAGAQKPGQIPIPGKTKPDGSPLYQHSDGQIYDVPEK